MTIPITLTYGALVAILMAVLSTVVAVKRGATGIALGDGGNAQMALTVRRFGNLSEYAAMAILMLLLMELASIPDFWLHAYGMTFVALRLLHPFILFDSSDASATMKLGRFVAGAGTSGLLLSAGISLLIIGFR